MRVNCNLPVSGAIDFGSGSGGSNSSGGSTVWFETWNLLPRIYQCTCILTSRVFGIHGQTEGVRGTW